MATDPSRPENLATTLGEVADRTTLIVREEIELAKAEVSAKISKLGKGAVVAIAAGIFLSLAFVFSLHMVAWLLYTYVFNDVWLGYAVVVGALVLLAIVAGLLAYRWFKRGSPPTPEMAIEEAQRVKATVTGEPLDGAGAETKVPSP